MFDLGEVNVSVAIREVIDIDDVELTFTLLFEIIFEWRDNNLLFNYLKDDVKQNVIDFEEDYKYWHPNLKLMLTVPGMILISVLIFFSKLPKFALELN